MMLLTRWPFWGLETWVLVTFFRGKGRVAVGCCGLTLPPRPEFCRALDYPRGKHAHTQHTRAPRTSPNAWSAFQGGTRSKDTSRGCRAMKCWRHVTKMLILPDDLCEPPCHSPERRTGRSVVPCLLSNFPHDISSSLTYCTVSSNSTRLYPRQMLLDRLYNLSEHQYLHL